MSYGYGYAAMGAVNLTSAQWAQKYQEACAAGKNQSTLAALANAYRTAAVAEGAAVVALSCANAPARPTGPFGRPAPTTTPARPIELSIRGEFFVITSPMDGVLYDRPNGVQTAYLPINTRYKLLSGTGAWLGGSDPANGPLPASEFTTTGFEWWQIEAYPFGQQVFGWIRRPANTIS